jgi:CRISPR-associated protein Cas2
MTNRYYVAYDIADPKRLRRVLQIMKGVGEKAQFSVFCCDLSGRQREQLLLDLGSVIHSGEDQVLFIDLGPSRGLAPGRVFAIGRKHDPPLPGAIVV